MIALKTWAENSSGNSVAGSSNPVRWQLLIPSPPVGIVRVPLSAAIQCDSRQPYVTCHGRLERTVDPLEPGVDVTEFFTTSEMLPYGDPPRAAHLLWSLKLTPPVLVGGEYFIPVPAFPLIAGTLLAAEWAYATGGDAVRTRAVTVDVPLAEFDWSTVRPLDGQPRHSVVRGPAPRPEWMWLATLPVAPALWRWRRMQRRG